MHTMKGTVKNILLLLASLLLSAVLCEVFLSRIDYHYTPLSIRVLNKGDWRYHHAFEDKHFVYDPNLLWAPKKNYSVFNSQGFRGRELSVEKQEGEWRIFAVGDSNTLGWDQQNGPNWPLYLEDLLKKDKEGIVVINAGVYGYTSFQGVRRFKEILPYHPDMVLISFEGNDALRVQVSDKEFMARHFFRRINMDKLLMKSRIGQLAMAAGDKLLFRGKGEQLVPRVSVEEYTDNINEMISVARERGIRVVLLTRPFLLKNVDLQKHYAAYYAGATKDVARRSGVPVIDLASEFSYKDGYFTDYAHFNEAGHRLAAKMIYDRLKDLFLK